MLFSNFTLPLLANWVKENPRTAALYGTAGVGVVIVVVPAVVSSPALAAAGFGADGIVKASIAAGYQSAIGNVVTPSVFATLQSAAMGGYGVAIVNGIVSGGGAALAVGSLAAAMASDNPDPHMIVEYVSSWLRDAYDESGRLLESYETMMQDMVDGGTVSQIMGIDGTPSKNVFIFHSM
ncbi:hypothetical protein GGR54DRAFT_26111 [Hypoxylon sp. NC1633]|nr:hypothetical protein GGR54DRAFT_26111 [Hypoxylon sp. NC1633]